ncbi:oligosaccaryltransferase [Colletotrichum scovillei]|uniref:Dolichyl-diphosphooligosaccharide--protein glycosyltransferase subunit 4 n=1 Tax=Colletotrichum scovillei TaxID=1209932 RepID=A0A9P7RAN8_9PEZI|nr:oligosaccaryltransferase [Colletotrichum scovillei]KAG7072343.1 oligosaccaryltransferase [Colletotrichum scovillei]KAG7080752.1 oligosaccaryltransferase [Colletotrichum scovillei]
MVTHCHPHLKLHVRRASKSKQLTLTNNFKPFHRFLEVRHSLYVQSSRRSSLHITQKHRRANDPEPIMISDNDLYRLAIFLGSAAMVLIIFYHYVEVNTEEEKPEKATRPAKSVKAVS